eukprot:scaffold45333_cov53-Attheya_sp.AAC.1
MVVRLRLQRFGRKHLPFYRMVAANSRSPRDGKFLEILYNKCLSSPPAHWAVWIVSLEIMLQATVPNGKEAGVLVGVNLTSIKGHDMMFGVV